ncbi:MULTISPECIES: hypothetical protein [unclassified Rudaea]|uniref:Terminase small subunit n=1 Tax=marine sediment metagenome TaxID=412755 RepID=X1HCJ8_9ZZZZ|nr:MULTISPECIES: hypothetical protein [unclassified Rudaea]MBQ3301328.1 hypothetical protein [Eggerthellaceae bacterium]
MPIVNRREFAELVGYSPRQVADYLDRGMPCERSGKKGEAVEIDTAKAIRWMIENVRFGRPVSDDRERLAAAQADKAEFENAVRRGEFVSISMHGELLRRLAGEVAGQMAGFPGRVAPTVANMKDPALVRAKLIDECNDVRDAVAGVLGIIAAQFDGAGDRVPGSSGDSESAAEDNT